MTDEIIELINDILASRKFGSGDDFYMSDEEKRELEMIIANDVKGR